MRLSVWLVWFGGLMILVLTSGTFVYAYVASSTNFRLQTDSVNFSGGDFSTSTSFGLYDTAGENSSGVSTSTNFGLRAGYRFMLESTLSISSPGDVTLGPSITNAGGVATGDAAWTVVTDNPGGYALAIKASVAPALSSGAANFADYAPAGADPDYAWSVAAAAAEFGFSPEGSDIVPRYRDNGAACNAGAGDTADACWDAFAISNQTIASSTSSNQPAGTATTVKLQAEIGSQNSLAAGVYNASLTVTATAN